MALTKTPIELSSTPSIVDGGNATAITIDSSENVTFAGEISTAGVNTITSKTHKITCIESDQSNKQYQIGSFGAAYAIYDASNTQYRYTLTTSGDHIFNEGGVDCDFRVESDTNAYALFVNGGNNSVGINTNVPDGALTVVGTATSGDMLARFQHSVNDNDVKVIRVNAPNSSGTQGYVDVGVDPETTQGGLAVSTSSGGLLAGNANLNNAAIIWDSNKIVSMPGQPAFLVTPSSTQSNIAASDNVAIAFGTEIYDIGSNFASNAFTAPVSGRYQLNVNLRLNNVDSAAAYYHINLTTSNRVHYSIFDPDFGQDAAYYTIQLSVLADMDANDTAAVSLFQSGGTAQTDIHSGIWSTFSGYLAT